MTKRGIALLACKLIAIFAIYKAVALIGINPDTLAGLRYVPTSRAVIGLHYLAACIALSVPGVFGVLLWRYAGRIADAITSEMDDDPPGDTTRRSEDVEAIAFSALGVFILADASRKVMGPSGAISAWGIIVLIVSHTVVMCIVVWLLLGSRKVKHLFKKLRGRDREPLRSHRPGRNGTREQ